jgi:ankyrin repeat protein
MFCFGCQLKCVKPLLIKSDLPSQDTTALIWASVKGHIEVVKLLLAVPGIDYNHADDEVRINVLFWMPIEVC